MTEYAPTQLSESEYTYRGCIIKISFCPHTCLESWEVWQNGKKIESSESGWDLGHKEMLLNEVTRFIDWKLDSEEAT